MTTTLEILEQGHVEAEAALEALKRSWADEDAETAARRAKVLEAHAQGDRDRDAVRVALGGDSVLKEAEAPRMSSLPVVPLVALDQPT